MGLDPIGATPDPHFAESPGDTKSTAPDFSSMIAKGGHVPSSPPDNQWRSADTAHPPDDQLAMRTDPVDLLGPRPERGTVASPPSELPAAPGLLAQIPPGEPSLPAPATEPAGPAATEEVPPLHPRYQELFDTNVSDLTVNIKPPAGAFPDQMPLPPSQAGEVYSPDGMSSRGWAHTSYQWEATGLAHQPLYFEQPNLERYGYAPTRSRFGQSVISAAHFFGSVFILPYRLGAEPVYEQQYVLGHYRPGSYVPYEIHRPPLSWKGGALETAAVVGLIFAIP
jgi:hypothetical protein